MNEPSVEFVALVKDALEHLFDPAELESHDLGRWLLSESTTGKRRAQSLRERLLAAVDELNPRHTLPVGARQRRLHQLLELRYIEALPYRDVMAQLALSQPQYHREQRHAVESLASILWDQACRDGDAPRESHAAEPAPGGPFADHAPASANLVEVVDGVTELLRSLAAEAGVAIVAHHAESRLPVRAGRTALRQLLITLLGCTLEGVPGKTLVLRTASSSDGPALEAAYEGTMEGRPHPSQSPVRGAGYSGGEDIVPGSERLALAYRLAEGLGARLEVGPGAGESSLVIRLALPSATNTVLVVDDNADVVHLIRRLLAPRHYTVVGAHSVRDGLAAARAARPDVIVLDVMMPDEDGWDALQQLKHDPSTKDTPVIVCTILREGQLALSLGAAGFVRKPVTRESLLAALDRCFEPAGSAEAAYRVGSGPHPEGD